MAGAASRAGGGAAGREEAAGAEFWGALALSRGRISQALKATAERPQSRTVANFMLDLGVSPPLAGGGMWMKLRDVMRFLGASAAAIVLLLLLVLRVTSCSPVRPPGPWAHRPKPPLASPRRKGR